MSRLGGLAGHPLFVIENLAQGVDQQFYLAAVIVKQKYTSNIKNMPFLFLEMKRNKQSQRHEAEIDNLKTTMNETDNAREKAALQKSQIQYWPPMTNATHTSK